MISLLLIKKIAELFLEILMGFILVKSNLLKSKDSMSLSVVSLYLIMPCVIIEAFQLEYSDSIRNGLLLGVAAAVIIHAVLLVLITLFGKLFHLDEVEKASVMYSNGGNLIIPIVTSVLGKEWVIYTCAFMSVQLVLLWTHARMLLCKGMKFNLKKLLLNINILSIFVGIFLFAARIQLPGIVSGAMSSVSSMIGPLCMIVTGMLIGNMDFKKVVSYKKIYLITFLKMIVCPLILLVILKYSGMDRLVEQGRTVLLISLLAAVAPSGSTVTQMSQVYGKDAEYASTISVVTTLVCIVTMPFMVLLYQL